MKRKANQNRRTKPTEKEPFVPAPPKPGKQAQRAIRRVEAMAAIVARFDAKTLTELERRARGSVHDGFPPSTGGGGVSMSEVARPTEASALVGLPAGVEGDEQGEPDDWSRHEAADPVGDAIDEVFASLAEALGVLMAADDQRGYILAVGKEGRVSSVASCQACTRDVLRTPEDRLRAGFCSACYSAWVRAGRPERVDFIRDRRAALTEVA